MAIVQSPEVLLPIISKAVYGSFACLCVYVHVRIIL